MDKKKLPSEKNVSSDVDSGIVIIISVRLKSKSLLRKEIYGDLEKSLKPLKMASDQNEKSAIGISTVEYHVLANYNPSPRTTRKMTFLHSQIK